jgi:Leucine-rich repeat (LRR) protein
MSSVNFSTQKLGPTTSNVNKNNDNLTDIKLATKSIASVIFLDIDGVLFDTRKQASILQKTTQLFPNSETSEFNSYHLDTAASHLFEPSAVSNLEALIKDVQNVGIVISSSWREKRSVEQLQEILQKHAFAKCIIGKTPDDNDIEFENFISDLKGRAKEIAYWLSKHLEILYFVILDDIDIGLSESFPNNFVRINPIKLLSEDDVKKTKGILTPAVPNPQKLPIDQRIDYAVKPLSGADIKKTKGILTSVPFQRSDDDSYCELSDGQFFNWKSFTEVSPQEMDRRIVLLSQNPPKIISKNHIIEDMINEMCVISPLWSHVEISDQRDMENRATLLFFEVVAKQFEPLQLFLKKRLGRHDRYELERTSAELMARELRFFIRRIASRSTASIVPLEHVKMVSSLDFSGFYLGFLPDEIGLFENLYELKLVNCDLTKLPASIGNLKRLHILELGGNRLEELPKTITDCPKLHLIYLFGNKLSYSSLLDLAKDFLSKDNAWGAVKVASKALDITGKDDSNEICLTSPYTEVIELLKTITEKLFLKDKDYKYLSGHIIEAVNKIPDEYNKFESFLEILEGTGKSLKNCFSEDPQYDELIEFINTLADKCLEIAHSLPRDLGRHSALCEIAKVLFSINYNPKAIEVAEQAVNLANSRHFLTKGVNDIKGSELEHISNILENALKRLAREDRVGLATQVAKLIPDERKQSTALANIEYFRTQSKLTVEMN